MKKEYMFMINIRAKDAKEKDIKRFIELARKLDIDIKIVEEV